jgi:glycosyltransferase involved in cell wall biosynthesis
MSLSMSGAHCDELVPPRVLRGIAREPAPERGLASVPGMSRRSPAVSVVIPTYHRPALLRAAVVSALAQDLAGDDFEVVIAVSDAAAIEDVSTARELAEADSRVVVTVASRLGPAAARNAGMAVARGHAFAFIDDDCEARPGWLVAGLDRLRAVGVVQGRTVPAEVVESVQWAYTISVDELSYLWETCNLFVTREAALRVGGFDEDWNPRRKPGTHWGEDTEWGWRLVRAGATYAFEPNAIVAHAVFPRTYAQWIEYKMRVRFMPLFVRAIPEVRRHLTKRYFADAAHMRIVGAAALTALAGAANQAGRRRISQGLLAAATVPILQPAYDDLRRSAGEGLALCAALYGSARHRRVVL